MKTTILITLLIIITNISFSQIKTLESFKSGNDSVAVTFYDPLVSLIKQDEKFDNKNDKQKSKAFDKYLHENALYLFKLTNTATKGVSFLCIRGNPEKIDTKFFYKVELIKDVPVDFNPTNNNYADKVVQVIDNINCAGTLFENMYLFDDEKYKNIVGNGILLFGYFRRVQPYSEIKASINTIIEQLASK